MSEPSQPIDFFLDAPPARKIPAGGKYAETWYFMVLHPDAISLSTLMSLSGMTGLNVAEAKAFGIMSAVVSEWNVKLKDGSIAPITPDNFLKLPVVAIAPLLKYVEEVGPDFLALASAIPNPPKSLS